MFIFEGLRFSPNTQEIRPIRQISTFSLGQDQNFFQDKNEYNSIYRFVSDLDRLVGEYKSISADLELWSKDLDLNSPEKINQIEQKVSKLSSLLEEKATEKDMLASEGAKLESKCVKDAAQKITEKLQVLQKAALKTEQQCKDLQVKLTVLTFPLNFSMSH